MSRLLVLHCSALAAAGASLGLAPGPLALPLAGAVLASHAAAIAWGVAHPASSLLCPVLTRGPDPDRVALTFDDGPGEATDEVLAVLRGAGIKATFFVIGRNVAGREETLAAVVRDGHTVGSHTFAHSWATNLSSTRAMTAEIGRGIDAIAGVVGRRPRLYRPPMGLKTPALARAAAALDLAVVGWRHRAGDGGRGSSAERIVARLARARGGDVLLLHDGVEPGRRCQRGATVEALARLIAELEARGLGFATADALLGVRAYA